jgi:hypothetical protein
MLLDLVRKCPARHELASSMLIMKAYSVRFEAARLIDRIVSQNVHVLL